MQDSIDNPTAGNDQPTGELYKFFVNEIAFRRNRKQEVFAWTSSLLVAIIGGVIALTYTKGTTLICTHKVLLTFAILVLCGFACYWIHIHWKVQVAARRQLSFYYNKIAENNRDNPTNQDWPSLLAITALSLAALASLWMPFEASTR